MDIQSAILTNPLSIKTVQLSLSQYLAGQILNANVIERKSANTFVLQIGNQHVEAKTIQSKPLNLGDQLKLIVEKQDNPIVLRVVQESTAKAPHEIKQQLLREVIPKQAGLEKLTDTLSQVSNNMKQIIKILPMPIEQQFKKLIEQLPTKNSINNEAGLKTAIKNSGLFLEAKLLTEAKNRHTEVLLKNGNTPTKPSSHPDTTQFPQHAITKDLKTNLLQLVSVINKYSPGMEVKESPFVNQTQIPLTDKTQNIAAKSKSTIDKVDLALKADTEIINKHIESSIARIEVNQSKAIVSNDNQMPLWSIEIPVKDKQDFDLLKLDIQPDKDSKSSDPEKQLWSTSININFENIGTLSAKLTIINKEVNASLWSENKILTDLIRDNLFLLNKQIENCGLSSGKIICLDEAPLEQKVIFSKNNLINISI